MASLELSVVHVRVILVLALLEVHEVEQHVAAVEVAKRHLGEMFCAVVRGEVRDGPQPAPPSSRVAVLLGAMLPSSPVILFSPGPCVTWCVLALVGMVSSRALAPRPRVSGTITAIIASFEPAPAPAPPASAPAGAGTASNRRIWPRELSSRPLDDPLDDPLDEFEKVRFTERPPPPPLRLLLPPPPLLPSE